MGQAFGFAVGAGAVRSRVATLDSVAGARELGFELIDTREGTDEAMLVLLAQAEVDAFVETMASAESIFAATYQCPALR